MEQNRQKDRIVQTTNTVTIETSVFKKKQTWEKIWNVTSLRQSVISKRETIVMISLTKKSVLILDSGWKEDTELTGIVQSILFTSSHGTRLTPMLTLPIKALTCTFGRFNFFVSWWLKIQLTRNAWKIAVIAIIFYFFKYLIRSW